MKNIQCFAVLDGRQSMVVGNKVKRLEIIDQLQGRFDHPQVIADMGYGGGFNAGQSIFLLNRQLDRTFDTT